MTKETRIAWWCLVALGSCSLVPFGVHWLDLRLAFALGREAGAKSMHDTFCFRQSFAAGMTAYCVIIICAAWRAKLRLSFLWYCFIGLVAFVCSVVTPFGWVLVGQSPSDCYFDGFAKRVAASGIENKAVAWADQLAASPDITPKGDIAVEIPADKVPPFFAPVFGKMGAPVGMVFFGRDGKFSYVEIYVGLAEIVRPVEFGISVVQDADEAVGRLPEIYAGRRCGKRLMAFWGGG